MSRFLCSSLLLLCSLSPACAQEEQLQAQPAALEIRSCYLVQPLTLPGAGRAHRIFLQYDLGGDRNGVLHLDPNKCTLSPFGDPEACTEMAAQPIQVTLEEAKLADRTGAARRLFLLDGVPGKAKLHLVVPKQGEPGHRLVVSNAEGEITAIVPLAPVEGKEGAK